MSDRNVPLYGQPYNFDIALPSRADPFSHQVNPTLATGDVKITKDNGGYANIATLPTVSPAGGSTVKVSLSATEMTADKVTVKFVDAAGAEWGDLQASVQPMKGILFGGSVADAGAAAGGFLTSLSGLGTNALLNKYLVFTSGSLIGQSQRITTYTTGTGAVAFTTSFTAAPANGDDFAIVGAAQ